ncbi:unnamed protein product [Miscanthus lutarioriparius]|uniref:Uncharacterized protein n=1 Tax=Miscanthus lutarioriparius TaxID=422564 RepID=A0A811N5R9_9POAL|nr:unnamed protein product [Miscanthus lutarioriparius]
MADDQVQGEAPGESAAARPRHALIQPQSIGVLTNAFTSIGRGVLQFTVLTGAAMINLIIYTLWAAMRQYQVTTYCPFLINHVLMFLFYLIIQAYCPLGSFNVTFFGCFFAMMFAVFIVHDIPLLIERHSYNEHVFAAISLFPDLINLPGSYCLAPCKRHC